MKLGTKFFLVIVGLALSTSAAVGGANYISARSTIEQMTENRLVAEAEGRALVFSGYLSEIQRDLQSLAKTYLTRKALTEFKKGWKTLGEGQMETLQSGYITNNPQQDPARRDELEKAGSSHYDKAHKNYHGSFRAHVRDKGYGDLFLFDANGNLIYSVLKQSDFATNVVSGEWRDSDLGKAYRAAMAGEAGQVHFFDFRPYAPKAGAPAGFIATPIALGKSKIGVIALQMPIDQINAIAGRYSGLGETGNVFLVGSDLLARNDSKRTPDHNELLLERLAFAPVEAALGGTASYALVENFQAAPHNVAAMPLPFNGINFALLVAQAVSETHAPLDSLRNWGVLIALLCAMIAGAIGFLICRPSIQRIKGLVTTMSSLAEGDTEVVVSGTEGRDIICQMARAVEVFRSNAIEKIELEAEQARAAQDAEMEKRAAMSQLADSFDASVEGVVTSVSEAADQMVRLAGQLSSSSGEANSKATAIARASSQATDNVNAAAAASEEMAASISCVAEQVEGAASMTRESAERAEKASDSVAKLSESAQTIGDVVQLISDIAEQTNLLALNATIEAARAGESGKGFAVVASEVKNLATQTARATEQISSQISAMQSDTHDVVQAIESIGQTISGANHAATAISTAVEEQLGATQEIARSTNHAAGSASEVNGFIGEVSQSVTETGTVSGEVTSAASSLAGEAKRLRTEVSAFLKSVRAA